MWKSRFALDGSKASILTADAVNQATDSIVENTVFLHQGFYLLVRVHDGRVVFTAKLASDFRIAVIRQPLA